MTPTVLWQERGLTRIKMELAGGILRVTGYGEEPVASGYFVAPTGKDSNPGTLEKPLRTITHALSRAVAGDTVYVRSGTYSEHVILATSGRPAKPVTLRNYPGEVPIIDGKYEYPPGDDAQYDPPTGKGRLYDGLVRVSGNYVVVDGLEITRSRGAGIRMQPTGGHHVTVRNCHIHDNRMHAVHAREWTDLVYESNQCWHNGDFLAPPRPVGYSWGGTLFAKFSRRVVIRRNVVRDNWGEGILLSGSDECLVEDNTAYDNMATNLYSNTSGHMTIQRNLVYSSSTHIPPNKGISVGLDWDISGGKGYSTDHLVINNIVAGCHFNFSFNVYTAQGDWPGRGALINTVIAHNTFVNANAGGTSLDTAMACIFIAPRDEHNKVRIENNIFVQDLTKARLAQVPDDSAFRWSNNLWSSPPPSQAQGSGDVGGDPHLEKADVRLLSGKVAPIWFTLRADSPCLDAAKVVAEVDEDYWGVLRGLAPDIGALEFK